ncbi:MAG: hypothetical protein LUF92_07180 [Clostridiales bacterium]|nr:hypothetical protein [Clostridiales bacterium]
MIDNELLLAMSDMMDKKLKPLEDKTKNIESLLENDILPRLQNTEACYTSTYRRYSNSTTQIDAMQSDIDITTKLVAKHSEILQNVL